MKLLLNIDVEITESFSVKGAEKEIVMIHFTAAAHGSYFNGNTVGAGVDTQKIDIGGKCTLSARYMLEGKDFEGQPCRIFIENNSSENGFTPTLVTDSKALSEWSALNLSAEILPTDGGVNVLIYSE